MSDGLESYETSAGNEQREKHRSGFPSEFPVGVSEHGPRLGAKQRDGDITPAACGSARMHRRRRVHVQSWENKMGQGDGHGNCEATRLSIAWACRCTYSSRFTCGRGAGTQHRHQKKETRAPVRRWDRASERTMSSSARAESTTR